jgi:hypothetical protein
MLAGEVRVVTGVMLGMELPAVRRHQPGAGDVFGIDVDAMPFCKSGCGTAAAVVQKLALVGSASRALTFFSLAPGNANDPRTP